MYGGCLGNANNFKTKWECETHCVDHYKDYDGLDNQAVVYTAYPLNDHETKSDKLGKDEWHNQMFKAQSMTTLFWR